MTLDQQIAWIGSEQNYLRKQNAGWAYAKITTLDEIRASLEALKEFQRPAVREDGVPRTFPR